MKNFAGNIPGVLLGAATTIVLLQPQVAMALSTDEISDIAKEFTVSIDSLYPGSGIIIAQKRETYYGLTAAHVIQHQDLDYEVVTHDKKRYLLDLSTVKRLPGADLAVFQFSSSQTYRVAKLAASAQLREGSPVYVAGYPKPGQGIREYFYRFTSGIIAGRPTRPLEGGYALVYENTTRVGMSGGPVLDAEGRVVGIHGKGEGEPGLHESGAAGFNKIGFNWGIPIETFIDLAKTAGINLRVSLERSAPRPQQPVLTRPAGSSPGRVPSGRPESYRADPAQGGTPVCPGRC